MSKIDFCVACGSRNIGHFIGREMTTRCHHIERIATHLSGIECREPECGEIVFLNESGKRFADAGDQAVLAFREEMKVRYEQAMAILGIKKGDALSLDAMKQMLIEANPQAIESVVLLIDLMTNHRVTLSHIR